MSYTEKLLLRLKASSGTPHRLYLDLIFNGEFYLTPLYHTTRSGILRYTHTISSNVLRRVIEHTPPFVMLLSMDCNNSHRIVFKERCEDHLRKSANEILSG